MIKLPLNFWTSRCTYHLSNLPILRAVLGALGKLIGNSQDLLYLHPLPFHDDTVFANALAEYPKETLEGLCDLMQLASLPGGRFPGRRKEAGVYKSSGTASARTVWRESEILTHTQNLPKEG